MTTYTLSNLHKRILNTFFTCNYPNRTAEGILAAFDSATQKQATKSLQELIDKAYLRVIYSKDGITRYTLTEKGFRNMRLLAPKLDEPVRTVAEVNNTVLDALILTYVDKKNLTGRAKDVFKNSLTTRVYQLIRKHKISLHTPLAPTTITHITALINNAIV